MYLTGFGRTVRAAVCALGLVTLAPAAATAATITFAGLPDEGGATDTYSEGGFTVVGTGGAVGYFTTPGRAHIDDAGTGFASMLSFSHGGGLFDAAGFTLVSFGYDYFDPPVGLADNILVRGYDGGGLIAQASFLLSDILDDVQTIMLDASFSNLTLFTIEMLYQDPNGDFCAPCGHFDLDSVELVPVAAIPLPASGWALIAALLATLGLVRRRRVAVRVAAVRRGR
jgi:hypothetical protein